MILSIIILNYKTARLVKQCIKNIVNLSLPINYEIIVVDNNSQDQMEKILKERFGQELKNNKIKFIQSEKNKGMGAGNNLGVKNARGEFILILNPDVVVLQNSIEQLLDFLKNNSKAGCVAPKLLYPNKKYQPSRYRFPKFFIPVFMRTGLGRIKFGQQKIKKYLMEDVKTSAPHKVGWVRGSVTLMRKQDFNQINGFDEKFFFYVEDTDLCRRLWKADREVWYLPSAEMIHYYSRESRQNRWIKDLFNKMAWVHINSWIKYFWKWNKKFLF